MVEFSQHINASHLLSKSSKMTRFAATLKFARNLQSLYDCQPAPWRDSTNNFYVFCHIKEGTCTLKMYSCNFASIYTMHSSLTLLTHTRISCNEKFLCVCVEAHAGFRQVIQLPPERKSDAAAVAARAADSLASDIIWCRRHALRVSLNFQFLPPRNERSCSILFYNFFISRCDYHY